jgi:hypothetical protein
MSQVWKKCSSCKRDILCGAQYYLCSVSTCKHPRTGLRFCSVECWDAHLGFVNHRESWAEEAKAPLTPGADETSTRAPVRKIVSSAPTPPAAAPRAEVRSVAPQVDPGELETLVVVSKVKQLIRDNSEFNTSQCCIDELTRRVAEMCMDGIAAAETAGRKTVMGRDIK